jgi:hypothetical protein
MESPRGVMNIAPPENWDKVIEFTESPRNGFDEIRKARPDQELVKKAMLQLIENCKYNNCKVNEGYVKAMGMKP